MKGQRQLNMHIIFESADAVYPKLSKLVCACRNYSLLELAHMRHSVVLNHIVPCNAGAEEITICYRMLKVKCAISIVYCCKLYCRILKLVPKFFWQVQFGCIRCPNVDVIVFVCMTLLYILVCFCALAFHINI